MVVFDPASGTVDSLKTSTIPNAPGQAIVNALDEGGVAAGEIETFTHGTTVGTNALIERTGCRVALVTTRGFEDMPFIQRINRKVLYDLRWRKTDPLVASRRLCLGLDERLDADGAEVKPVDVDEVRALCRTIRESGAEAVAVCLLFSYVSTEHEERVKRILEEELGGLPVSVSHEVAPIWREYERSSTTIADAYLRPLFGRYVTSLDASLREAGMTRERTLIKSIGAGGGSIAWVDAGGFLRVGPRSAGAQPGPICYGRGGTEPTVTDANLLLGRLDPEYFLNGRMRLDPSSVTEAMEALGEPLGLGALELAASIVEIANENMASAINMDSLERGHDPRRFALLAFGGAGPLHAASVARLLGIPRVIVPQHPGVFSALGLLLANIRVDKVWTQAFRSNDVDAALVNRQFDRITERALAELRQEGFAGEPEIRRAINMRYFGQNYEHEVEIEAGELDEAALERAFRHFDGLHAERYGYLIEGEVIELVSFKVTVVGRRRALGLARARETTERERSSREVYVRGHGFVDAAVVHRSALEPGE